MSVYLSVCLCVSLSVRMEQLSRKATISFVMSVYLSVCLCVSLSVRMEQLSSHWTKFHEILYLNIRKFVEKIKFSLKSDNNNGYFT